MVHATPAASLVEFARTRQPSRPRCLLCTVDPDVERQAREGKQAGITYRVIAAWLETFLPDEVPISKGRLERHFQQVHMR